MSTSIVLMSDIHGNLPALQAVVDSLPESRTVVVAGDHCLDGPCPAQVLDLLRELGWTLITGNTDRDIVDESGGKTTAWTRGQLGEERLRFLAQLEFSVTVRSQHGAAAIPVISELMGAETDSRDDVLVVHANPLNLEDQLHPTLSEKELLPYLENVEQGIIAFGHLHTPYVRPVLGKLLIDVSSVGHPKDKDLRASYTILNVEDGERSVNQVRIPYDVEKTLWLMRESGMPSAEKHMEALRKASY